MPNSISTKRRRSAIPDSEKVPNTGYYVPSCCNFPHRLKDGYPKNEGRCTRKGRAFIVACYLKGM